MASAPSVLIVQTVRMVTKHKYLGRQCIDGASVL